MLRTSKQKYAIPLYLQGLLKRNYPFSILTDFPFPFLLMTFFDVAFFMREMTPSGISVLGIITRLTCRYNEELYSNCIIIIIIHYCLIHFHSRCKIDHFLLTSLFDVNSIIVQMS